MKDWQFSSEARETLRGLCARYPHTPFLALGQTVLWDEPVKAFFPLLLAECAPQAQFWHGVHDTDYFSRLRRPLLGSRPYAVVEHTDSSTRGLWVAMGEASRLFGAEVVPTRAKLRQYGCNLAKARAAEAISLDSITSAWGWKGLVSTGERELVGRDVRLADLLEELVALAQEAMEATAEALSDENLRRQAFARTEEFLLELRAFAEQHPAATLSQLYQHLLGRFYETLLGEVPGNLKITSSASLFRFHPQTASQPRFSPLEVFLHPRSRLHARRAYDEAVIGSGIYTLEQFGPDALPFDLVVPGRGRGTIGVSATEVVIHTPQPISLPTSGPVEEPVALAELLTHHLGEDLALVGKAVVFITMIAQEFIPVFHQGASAYVEHTRELVAFLQKEGISLECHPILRLGHSAWDALGATRVHLRLPAHLAEAFGRTEIPAQDFSGRWRDVAQQQRNLLQSLAEARKPADLMAFLAGHFMVSEAEPSAASSAEAEKWPSKLSDYLQARRTLVRLGEELNDDRRQISRLRNECYQLRQEIQRLETEKGKHLRETLYGERSRTMKPLLAQGLPAAEVADAPKLWRRSAEAHRRALQEQIAQKRNALAARLAQLQEIKEKQRAREEALELQQAGRAALQIEAEAEAERLRIVRNALLTAEGLEQTDRRPTGWWFPLVSPDGKWFRALSRASRLEVEPLCPTAP